jgi:NAD(P)-dependent dehydrogenase (short-subunit alcohol dehydrogenase family)
MPSPELAGTTALVTGAGRGFGRAIATALTEAGATVVGVARDRDQLGEVRAELGATFVPVTGDATDPTLAGVLLERHRPRTLVLNAGAAPLMRPLQHQTWETFSRNWEVDVQHVFHWTREALLLPLEPGSAVIAVSSGAALAGSPGSGGYAGAKATIRLIASYAGTESERSGLGVRFLSVLPTLTPATALGSVGVAGYAAREGVDVAMFLDRRGPTLATSDVGDAIRNLAVDSSLDGGAYIISPAGLAPVPA